MVPAEDHGHPREHLAAARFAAADALQDEPHAVAVELALGAVRRAVVDVGGATPAAGGLRAPAVPLQALGHHPGVPAEDDHRPRLVARLALAVGVVGALLRRRR